MTKDQLALELTNILEFSKLRRVDFSTTDRGQRFLRYADITELARRKFRVAFLLVLGLKPQLVSANQIRQTMAYVTALLGE